MSNSYITLRVHGPLRLDTSNLIFNEAGAIVGSVGNNNIEINLVSPATSDLNKTSRRKIDADRNPSGDSDYKPGLTISSIKKAIRAIGANLNGFCKRVCHVLNKLIEEK